LSGGKAVAAPLIDLLPPQDPALQEILAGLARHPKELPAKYFYDAAGSALFERICELPEYYLTRAELQLMERHAPAMAGFLGAGCELIEFGCGSGRKTRLLLEALQPLAFVPIDISRAALEGACSDLARDFPSVRITALLADYTRAIDYPHSSDLAIRRRAVYFPGSTVGNFTRDEATAFLRMVRDLVGDGGALVIGVDLKKDPAVLHAAYNDAAGVTAAFNLNMLTHINRRFGADFDLAGFEHFAFYDEKMGRIEMHLRALEPHEVRLAGRSFGFATGELMRTEISCKYDVQEFEDMGRRAGFQAARTWFDDGQRFAVFGFVAA
jgi:dimethylhistidine N-methyltransferase